MLHHLFIPERISVPIVIIMSILVFGLINYYRSSIVTETGKQDLESGKIFDRYIENNNHINSTPAPKRHLFVLVVYIISLLIIAFGSNTDRELFVPWEQVSLLQIVQLTAATTIAFFAPGYAIIRILDEKKRFGLLARLLIAYLLSIFLTGFTTYFTASVGADFSLTRDVLILIYSCVLVAFIVCELAKKNRLKFNNINVQYYRGFLSSSFPFRSVLKIINGKWMSSLRKNGSVIIVFASLAAMVVLSTYYLYGGFLIGDQWFHHGRALSFIAGTFEAASLSGEHLRNPPFMPALLAGFFTLSSMPSVNAYVAINFLNIIPVFAFYYMFSKWVPGNMRKAALLASVLFVLSSGFGWLYVLYLSVANQVTSEQASLDAFNDARIKSFDIFQPSSFIGVDHPGITSPLLVISLPAGLVLLGLVKESRAQRGPKIMGLNYLVIITIISLVGTLSHPEFYLFVIISSLAVIIFKLPRRNFIFAAFIISTSLAILSDMLPGQYITAVKIVGIPVIHLTWVFTSAIFMLSVFTTGRSVFSKISSKITHFMFQNTRTIRSLYRDFVEFPLLIALVSMLSYFFLFTFLVWGELTLQDVQIQTSKNGQQEVPWYLYPMKLGICGLLGLVFVVSYLLRRFEKEVFIFSIIIIIALLAGPYYDEHRFSKYIMMGLVGLAAIFLYNIMVSLNLRSKRAASAKLPLICISILISFMVVSASISVILFIGYSALAMENHYRPFERDLPKRNFPSLSEINLFYFLYNDLIRSGENYNAVVAPDEYKIRQNGFTGKLEAFVGIPTRKLLQGQPTLEASTLEEFYYLLNNTGTRYIILQKEDIISGRNFTDTKAASLGQNDNNLIEPIRFAFENFKKVYEDDDYIVVSVPDNLGSVTEGVKLPAENNENVQTGMELNNIVKLPGDVSERAKQSGIGVPWQTVMSSEISIGMAIMIPVIAVFFLRRLSMRRKID